MLFQKGNPLEYDMPAPFSRRDRKITLATGHVSQSTELGPYYIDMRPVLPYYSGFNYGQFDDKGVPMCGFGSFAEYRPVNIAQYGFILHDIYWHNKKNKEAFEIMQLCFRWFENNKIIKKETVYWATPTPIKKYNLEGGYASSMAQGEVISFYLRMFQLTGDVSILETAKQAYEFLKFDVSQGGVRFVDKDGNLWLEEYPSKKPSMVLNGFIYAIFGLFDLYRVTGENEIKKEFDACIKTLKENIPKYDLGFWTIYDQYSKDLVSLYYQKNVYVPQLAVLYTITGDPFFLKFKNKWEKMITPGNLMFVEVMYRIRPRWQKFLNFLK
jgi:heparosan-N-sulfate-glucuronate 5-epimerase